MITNPHQKKDHRPVATVSNVSVLEEVWHKMAMMRSTGPASQSAGVTRAICEAAATISLGAAPETTATALTKLAKPSNRASNAPAPTPTATARPASADSLRQIRAIANVTPISNTPVSSPMYRLPAARYHVDGNYLSTACRMGLFNKNAHATFRPTPTTHAAAPTQNHRQIAFE